MPRVMTRAGRPRRRVFVRGAFVVCAALALAAAATTPHARTEQLVAFTHVNVIDANNPLPRLDQTVLVRGRHIVASGDTKSVTIPRAASLIDGHGKYLVPGFWDMHVHTVVPGGRAVLALYVANGVLGVRDMAGDWNQIKQWRSAIAAGTLIGPRIVAAGPYIEGGDVPLPHLLARTPDEARIAVDSLVKLHVDFVKLHSQLKRDTYLAALRAARSRGLQVAGHVPRTVTAMEASDSGLNSLEHMLQIPTPCTPAESSALLPRFTVQSVLGRCTSIDQAPLYAHFVKNDTWIVPTLVAAYEIAHWPKRDLPGDAYAQFIPDSLRKFVAQIFPMPDSIPPDANTTGEAAFEKRIALVGLMHRAGVHILAGTDAPLRNSPPGFGLHQELELLQRAGISNYDILRLATLQPARFLGLADSLGTIEQGMLAELVLLDANPLDDIRNTRHISLVMTNGRLLRPEALLAH